MFSLTYIPWLEIKPCLIYLPYFLLFPLNPHSSFPGNVLFLDWKKVIDYWSLHRVFVCFLKDRKRWTIFDICIKLYVCIQFPYFKGFVVYWWIKMDEISVILISQLATLPTAEKFSYDKKGMNSYKYIFLISTKMMNTM